MAFLIHFRSYLRPVSWKPLLLLRLPVDRLGLRLLHILWILWVWLLRVLLRIWLICLVSSRGSAIRILRHLRRLVLSIAQLAPILAAQQDADINPDTEEELTD